MKHRGKSRAGLTREGNMLGGRGKKQFSALFKRPMPVVYIPRMGCYQEMVDAREKNVSYDLMPVMQLLEI